MAEVVTNETDEFLKMLEEPAVEVQESTLTQDPGNIIELRNVDKYFVKGAERIDVINGLNLTIPENPNGNFVAILGPSGSGKSTILQMLAGLLNPDGGEVLTSGNLVRGSNTDTITIPQKYTCMDWLSVVANVELGLKFMMGRKMSRKERHERAMLFLEKVGLADRHAARPSELSGGMQQRVAIARALAVNPKILLCDEPFGALDAQTRGKMQTEFLNLWSESKNTIVFVTHDVTEAALLADRIIVLTPRPARIAQDFTVPFARGNRIPNSAEFMDFVKLLIETLSSQSEPSSVRLSIPGTMA